MVSGKPKITLLAVGKLKENFWKDAVMEYTKRLSKYANFCVAEVPDVPDEGEGNAMQQKRAEGEAIIKKLKGYVILFELTGKELTSPEIAGLIEKKCTEGYGEFTFVIGGSRGVSEEVKKSADFMLCLGKATYSHQVMRVVAAEQIYRAMTIINGTGYHK